MGNTLPDSLALSRKALKIVVALNLLMGVFIVGLFVASLVASAAVFGALGVQVGDGNGALLGLDLDWNFSFTRWLSVLLLFVLARVFAQGARMREDLAGTV